MSCKLLLPESMSKISCLPPPLPRQESYDIKTGFEPALPPMLLGRESGREGSLYSNLSVPPQTPGMWPPSKRADGPNNNPENGPGHNHENNKGPSAAETKILSFSETSISSSQSQSQSQPRRRLTGLNLTWQEIIVAWSPEITSSIVGILIFICQ